MLLCSHKCQQYDLVHFSLTALVKLVDAGDVIGTHCCGTSEGKARIAPGNDGRLSVFGEGVTVGHKHNIFGITYIVVHTQTLPSHKLGIFFSSC